MGTYNIYSLKETDAYPDPTDKFYANPKIEAAKAELTEDHPSVTVAVSMGQKAAVLEGKVVDSASGNPTSARLIFLDEDGNGMRFYQRQVSCVVAAGERPYCNGRQFGCRGKASASRQCVTLRIGPSYADGYFGFKAMNLPKLRRLSANHPGLAISDHQLVRS